MILKIENAYNAENGVIAKAEKKYQDVLKELKEDDKIKVKFEFRKYKENIVKNSQLFLEFYNLNFKTIVFEKSLPFLKTSNKQTEKLKKFFADAISSFTKLIKQNNWSNDDTLKMHLDNVVKEMNNLNSSADIIKSLELFKQLLKEIQGKVSEILVSIAGNFRKFLNENDSYVTNDLFNTIVSWVDLNETYIMSPLFLNAAKFVYEIAKKSSSKEQEIFAKIWHAGMHNKFCKQLESILDLLK